MRSKVAIAGHPIHPMLVGLPTGMYIATAIGYTAVALGTDQFWLRATVVANALGVAGAVIASVPGFLEWVMTIPRRSAAKATGTLHMALNLVALVAFTVALLVGLSGWNTGVDAPWTAAVLSLLGLAIAAIGGWFGYALVQTHHVGIDLPAAEVTRVTRPIDLEARPVGTRQGSSSA